MDKIKKKPLEGEYSNFKNMKIEKTANLGEKKRSLPGRKFRELDPYCRKFHSFGQG